MLPHYLAPTKALLERNRARSIDSHDRDNESHISLLKKPVEWDAVTHEESVSSISSDFIVHPGPNKLHSPLGRGMNSPQYPELDVDESHDYQKQLSKDLEQPQFNKQHQITPIPETTTMSYETEYKHAFHSPLNTNSKTPPLSEAEYDELWEEMKEVLLKLNRLFDYEKTWIELALNEVKNKKFGPAGEYANIRMREKVKEGYGEKLTEIYPWDVYNAKIDLCKEFIDIYDKIQNRDSTD